MTTSIVEAGNRSAPKTRWVQLWLWFAAMAFVGTWQYGWNLFIIPMKNVHGWSETTTSISFTVLVTVEAISALATGYYLDRFHPKKMLWVSGICIGVGACINAVATVPFVLYFGTGIMAVGVGIVSIGAAIGANQWFPKTSGLATGTVVVGFVCGSLFLVLPMKDVIAGYGYQNVFLLFGISQGVLMCAFATFLRPPAAGEIPKPEMLPVARSDRDYTAREAINSWPFWWLFAIFALVGSGGLIVTAQFFLIAKSYGVVDNNWTMLGLTMTAFSWALLFDRIMNALCRPAFGRLSDKIGRENTMALAFLLEAVSIYGFLHYAHDPVMFLLLSGLIFFGWGEIFTLMPTTIADTYGTKHAQTIYGWLYTAKGLASISVPFATMYVVSTQNWSGVFYACLIADVLAAIIALTGLKSSRRTFAEKN